ncbi:hypothetical protein [Sphaerisporangium sp. NPDC051011]|uniref:hypothetical protein n=1 Tax=Sphaerisporangium sp. NPDC051011 TaxID=3155792 RepID=UPI0033FECFB3
MMAAGSALWHPVAGVAGVAPRGGSKKAVKLATAAREAADVRAFQVDPDVVALRIERLRGWVYRLSWVAIVMGLAFTAVNVQHFAAGDASREDAGWWSAWLLDPMVSLILIATLIGEQVIARYQVKPGGWIRGTKWAALAATYAMNTWSAWEVLDPASILLHSVPPVMVLCATEAVTLLGHQISQAVQTACRQAAAQLADTEPAGPAEPAAPPIDRDALVAEVRAEFTGALAAVEADLRDAVRALSVRPGPRTEQTRTDAPRTDPSGTDRTDDPPRTETDQPPAPMDREVFISEVREQILSAAGRRDRWEPNYPALMGHAGRSRSWVEKAVREARLSVIGDQPRTALTTRTPGTDQPRTDADPARTQTPAHTEGGDHP